MNYDNVKALEKTVHKIIDILNDDVMGKNYTFQEFCAALYNKLPMNFNVTVINTLSPYYKGTSATPLPKDTIM